MGIYKKLSIVLTLIISIFFLGCGDDTTAAPAVSDVVVEVPNTIVTEDSTVIDVNGTTIVVLTSYKLKFAAQDGVNTMELQSTKAVSFYVENSQGDKISDSDITSLSISLMSPDLGELKDIDNNTGDTLSYTTNNVSITIESNTVSGILPIEVNATYIDSNGDTQTLREVFGISILSGPPTAMDIEYDGTTYNGVKYVDRLLVTLVDKHSNVINTNPTVSASLIVSYAAQNETNATTSAATRLFIPTTSTDAAIMNPTTNTLTTTASLANVDMWNDFVITYGRDYVYNVSGKWDIASEGANSLGLMEKIQANANVSNVGFVVGNNTRYDICQDTEKAVGTIELESDTVDGNGTIFLNITYGNYLVGKTVAIGIDTIGYTADGNVTSKFGTIEKHTLRSTGFEATSCEVAVGATMTCDIAISMTDSKQWLRNSSFSYDVVVGGDGLVYSPTPASGIDTNIYACDVYNGISYERFDLNNTGTFKATFTLTNIVAGEF